MKRAALLRKAHDLIMEVVQGETTNPAGEVDNKIIEELNFADGFIQSILEYIGGDDDE